MCAPAAIFAQSGKEVQLKKQQLSALVSNSAVAILFMQISPDGRQFVTTSPDKRIRVFRYETGKLRRSYDESREVHELTRIHFRIAASLCYETLCRGNFPCFHEPEPVESRKINNSSTHDTERTALLTICLRTRPRCSFLRPESVWRPFITLAFNEI